MRHLYLAFLYSTVAPEKLPTNSLECVNLLNKVVLPALGLPTRTINFITYITSQDHIYITIPYSN